MKHNTVTLVGLIIVSQIPAFYTSALLFATNGLRDFTWSIGEMLYEYGNLLVVEHGIAVQLFAGTMRILPAVLIAVCITQKSLFKIVVRTVAVLLLLSGALLAATNVLFFWKWGVPETESQLSSFSLVLQGMNKSLLEISLTYSLFLVGIYNPDGNQRRP